MKRGDKGLVNMRPHL